MNKYKSVLASAVLGAALLVPLAAFAAGTWNTTGSYNVDVVYSGTTYPESLTLAQTGSTITGTSLDTIPAGSPFTVTGGTVVGTAVNFDASQNGGSVVVHFTGTIAIDGSMGGTWADTAGGLGRVGTWQTTSGAATFTSDTVLATAKSQCMNGGWMSVVDTAGHSFKNQGDCVSYIATKGKNVAAGN